jgi:hypothetical protein
MVRNVRHFILHSLAQAWALLLRSMSPSVRALAHRAQPGSEQLVSASTRFTMASVVVVADTDVPALVQQVADESRARFLSGALFGELARVGDANAVLVAHITERGIREAEHFIALYPR